MQWLLLGVALFIGTVLIGRWFVDADTKKVLKALRWTGAILAIVVGLFLIVSGRFSFLWIALMGLLPWISRFRMLRRMARSARGPSPGRQSRVDTRFVAMTLDHDTGDMDGEVLEGPFAGRQLSEMSLEDLLALFASARQSDTQSARVLEAYLDRVHGDSWQDSARDSGEQASSAARKGGAMTVEEAYQVLDLEPGASKEEIVKRHRDLMKKVHPDHGGSDYLASRINEAKECLFDVI